MGLYEGVGGVVCVGWGLGDYGGDVRGGGREVVGFLGRGGFGRGGYGNFGGIVNEYKDG